MNIRAITTFLNPGWPLDESVFRTAGEFAAAARPAFETAGYPVQTLRLACPPFPLFLGAENPQEILRAVRTIEAAAQASGFSYISLGPALPDRLHSYALIPDMLAASRDVSLSGIMAGGQDGISLAAVRACAGVIRQVSTISPDGSANLRFAALANVPPGAPFFPAAYHSGGPPAFALALEAAGLAVEAVRQADTLAGARQALAGAVERHALALTRAAGDLALQFNLIFRGLDFSLAPFPSEALSLGTAIEGLGVPALGGHGTLAAAAFLAEGLDRAQFQRAGFSGLMLPVVEDLVLAQRAEQGALSLKDLLLYSAVCGTGLDTVPLPGDTTVDELAAVLLDLAALSQRLDKPLTARLMPIPGKQAGDPAGFDFAYSVNSRVLPIQARPLTGLLAGDEVFSLRPRIQA